METRTPKIVFLAIALVAGIYFWSNYAQLPQVVASHFDAHGHPNGWQTKQMFFAFFLGAVAIAWLVGFVIPSLIARMPAQMINLPNKQYWLAPERKGETLAELQRMFGWFGCALLLVVTTAVNYAIGQNLPPASTGVPVLLVTVLVGFAVFTTAWSLRLIKRFAQVPPHNLSPR
ncbi:MAG TPA: DUF1648 domain-containing protein [Candidatus Acidoferrum sp.]|nr:DUF1648 domain-containing protein [Candidatus Acidoferrum sp.]